MKALNMNDNQKIIEGRKVIRCKWVYKIKYKYNGELECYKAQLVAKGYSQCESFDFDETFSSVDK